MENNVCLNCGTAFTNKFCSNCGQKTDTHRITPKHFFYHDILHGVWHLDKGILFTLHGTIIRPGQAALDYIKGKRILYYNVFYLCLILIGLNVFLNTIFVKFEEADYTTTEVDRFIEQNAKIFIFLFVPIFAFFGKLIFQKMKLNIAEHFIIAGIVLVRILIINIFADFLSIFFNSFTFSIIIISILFISSAHVYYDLGKNKFETWKLILKSIAIPTLTLVFALICLKFAGFLLKHI